MTRLVISVRDPAEAVLADAAGADLIDVKEPNRGALGRVDAAMVSQVRQAVPTAMLSVAMGELSADDATRFDWHHLSGCQLAKAAPAGCQTVSHWLLAFERWRAHLPSSVRPVIVAYADWQAANAPTVAELIEAARATDAVGFLVDTYDKRNGGLLAHYRRRTLAEWSATVRGGQRWFALAGSLSRSDIPQVSSCGADWLAFRSAACDGQRGCALSSRRVHDLRAALDATLAMERRIGASQ